MNKVIIVGHLAKDVEVRYTQSGKCVASFTVAVNRFGQQNQADFIPVVAWEKLAEICGNNLTKGRKVLVEGRLQIRTYDAADGQKRRVAEVIAQNVEFLGSKNQGSANTEQPSAAANSFGGEVFPEEDIPF